jgi:hypothetical protein
VTYLRNWKPEAVRERCTGQPEVVAPRSDAYLA